MFTIAPRPMKMGTIASPRRYDTAARHALLLVKFDPRDVTAGLSHSPWYER